MKPFNLEEALQGKPVQLRDGRKAFVMAHVTEYNMVSPVFGIVLSGAGSASLIEWSEDGSYGFSEHKRSRDIIGMWQETIRVNGFDVPKPEMEPLEKDQLYFIPCLTNAELYRETIWADSSFDRRMLTRGLIHLDKEAVTVHANATLLATRT